MLEPHQSIPNLVVKQHGGDNTCGGTCWEDSLVPGKKEGGKEMTSISLTRTREARSPLLAPRETFGEEKRIRKPW